MKPKDQLAEDAYTIEPLSPSRAIVRFAKFCNQYPHNSPREAAYGLGRILCSYRLRR